MATRAVTFDEVADHERGFAVRFDTEIAPHLDRLEAERQRLRKQFWQRALAAVLLSIGTIMIAWLLLEEETAIFVSIFAGFAGVIAVIVVRCIAAGNLDEQVREIVMPVVCDFLGGLAYDRKAKAFPTRTFYNFGLVDSYADFDSAVEDHVRGTHRDTGYDMAEARLRRKVNKNTVTVFNGLLFAIDVPVPFEGRILIGRNYGLGNSLALLSRHRRNLTELPVAHGRFEQDFMIFAEDPDEAKRLLTSSFLDTMVVLADSYGASKVIAAFADGRFWLALSRPGKYFEMGGVDTPLTALADDVHKVLFDLTIPRRLVDHLHGDWSQVVV